MLNMFSPFLGTSNASADGPDLWRAAFPSFLFYPQFSAPHGIMTPYVLWNSRKSERRFWYSFYSTNLSFNLNLSMWKEISIRTRTEKGQQIVGRNQWRILNRQSQKWKEKEKRGNIRINFEVTYALIFSYALWTFSCRAPRFSREPTQRARHWTYGNAP
jgi:hypothetical protein